MPTPERIPSASDLLMSVLVSDEPLSARLLSSRSREEQEGVPAHVTNALLAVLIGERHEAEMALLGKIPPARIMKVPHHGSKTSSDSAWIAATRPRIALVSCGERNRFGHPDPATVGRYLLAGARVFRTDREGAIRITPVPGGALVSTRAHPAPEFLAWDPPAALSPSGHSP